MTSIKRRIRAIDAAAKMRAKADTVFSMSMDLNLALLSRLSLLSTSICFGAQSIEHGNVLSEKINFSAPGGRKVAIFGMEDLDPQYFDVSNFSDPPDPPYMSKNANMCYF